MIHRTAQEKLLSLANSFKAVAVVGPRQSGKTTLVKSTFPEKPYYSMENMDVRTFAMEDPRGFLSTIDKGAILDEVQRTPILFSYLQEIIDNSTERGKFILTGSNNFLIQQNITQSLAGRIGYLNLLPFSVQELQEASTELGTDEELMFKGFYPPVYDQPISPVDWYPNYIKTYIERDVRQIKNITDLIVFEKFMKVMAGRTGQELNLNAISIDVGADTKTIQSWLGILESSFVIHLLRAHHANFNKTLVKRPKIYFYDTGVVCALLGITEAQQLANYPLKGAIFETMVVSEMLKSRHNAGTPVNLYYWRDKAGHEIDVVIDKAGELCPVEIKSGKTMQTDFLKNIKYWNELAGNANALLLYGGEMEQKRSDGTHVLNWRGFAGTGV